MAFVPPPDHSRFPAFAPALALLFAAATANQVRWPGIDAGLPNFTTPLIGGLLLVAAPAGAFRRVLSSHRPFVGALLALFAWSALSALASDHLATAIRPLARAIALAPAALALFLYFREPERRRSGERVLLGILAALALLGVVESFAPGSELFRIFRSERSLTILPRIASLFPSPNPYGVLMATAFALSEGLARRRRLAPAPSAAASLLFLSQAAQSGSRNAWGVVVLVLVALAATGTGRRRRPVAGLIVFGAMLWLLPVPAYQLGIEARSPVARSLLDDRYRNSPSLADPLQSLALRSKLWRAAVAEVRDRPLLGVGPGVFTRVVAPTVIPREGLNAHNLPLGLAVDIGLPGLLLAIAALATLRPWRSEAEPWRLPLAAMLVGQLFDCFLYEPVSVLTFVALAAGAAGEADGAAAGGSPAADRIAGSSASARSA